MPDNWTCLDCKTQTAVAAWRDVMIECGVCGEHVERCCPTCGAQFADIILDELSDK